MDNSELIGAIFMDLSKAFDLVNHDVLLEKLAKYHVSPQALQWFTSYLNGRSQQCSILGSLSSTLTLERGVPQGSIYWDPFFFPSIYMTSNYHLVEPTQIFIRTILQFGRLARHVMKSKKTLQHALDILQRNGSQLRV